VNKKGASIILMIFEVIVVILVIVLSSSYAKSLAEKDSTIRLTEANDLRFMVNALVSVSGDAIVHYPENTSAYTFVLGQDRVAVFKQGDSENNKVEIKFFLPAGYQASGIIEGKPYLCLEKSGKIIHLRECLEEEL